MKTKRMILQAINAELQEEKQPRKKQPAKEEPVRMFEQFQLLEVWLENNNAPVFGRTFYFVLECGKHRTMLFHPFTLTRFGVPTIDLDRAKVTDLGTNELRTKLAGNLEQRVTYAASRNEQAPYQVIRQLLAHLRKVAVSAIPIFKQEETLVAAARKPAGFAATKKVGVFDKIQECFEKGSTLEEVLDVLKKTFPDRPAAGMVKTIAKQKSAMPKRLNREMIKTEVKKRGLVYKLKE